MILLVVYLFCWWSKAVNELSLNEDIETLTYLIKNGNCDNASFYIHGSARHWSKVFFSTASSPTILRKNKRKSKLFTLLTHSTGNQLPPLMIFNLCNTLPAQRRSPFPCMSSNESLKYNKKGENMLTRNVLNGPFLP